MDRVGHSFADTAERSALSQAQIWAGQVNLYHEQSVRIQPLVKPIGAMQIAKGSVRVIFSQMSENLDRKSVV